MNYGIYDMRTENSSVEKIQARRNELTKIMLEYQQKGKIATRDQYLEELAKSGFCIDIATLYRDKIAINRTNTFVEEIAESQYSAMQEDIYNKILYIEEQALLLYDKDWKVSRIVKRNLPNGSITESSIVHDDKPKLQCLGLIKDLQTLKQNMLKGENIQLGVTLMGKKLGQVKEELELVTKERDKLKKLNYAKRN
jgi:hypothetical protein